jgi:hypothetical protein
MTIDYDEVHDIIEALRLRDRDEEFTVEQVLDEIDKELDMREIEDFR